jgi:type IV pilus biogenesis/stability protein PilW
MNASDRLVRSGWRKAGPLCLLSFLAVSAASGKATGDAMSFYRLAQVQFEQGKTQEAIASLKKALSRNPKLAEAHDYLGIIYLQQSDPQQAAKYLKKAVALNPYYTDAHNTLGVVYTELKKYDRAVAEFDLALKDRTYGSPEKIHFNLGRLYLDRGMNDQAIHSFEEAVRIKSDYLPGMLGLGQAYQSSGRLDLARQQYQKIVRLDPKSAEAVQARQFLDRQRPRDGS